MATSTNLAVQGSRLLFGQDLSGLDSVEDEVDFANVFGVKAPPIHPARFEASLASKSFPFSSDGEPFLASTEAPPPPRPQPPRPWAEALRARLAALYRQAFTAAAGRVERLDGSSAGWSDPDIVRQQYSARGH